MLVKDDLLAREQGCDNKGDADNDDECIVYKVSTQVSLVHGDREQRICHSGSDGSHYADRHLQGRLDKVMDRGVIYSPGLGHWLLRERPDWVMR